MRATLVILFCLIATGASAFEGSYTGENQSLKITKSSANRYTLSLEVAVEGCQGDLIVKGRARGKTLTATYEDGGNLCTFTVKKTKQGLNVSEDNCWMAHGASCSYDGDYTFQ